jgi:hypothetical protein
MPTAYLFIEHFYHKFWHDVGFWRKITQGETVDMLAKHAEELLGTSVLKEVLITMNDGTRYRFTMRH